MPDSALQTGELADCGCDFVWRLQRPSGAAVVRSPAQHSGEPGCSMPDPVLEGPDWQNDSAATVLREQLASQCSRRGQHYARQRLWALMFWQPLYLSVCSQYCHQQTLALGAFQLHWGADRILGYEGLGKSVADTSGKEQWHELVTCCLRLKRNNMALRDLPERQALQLVCDALAERLLELGADDHTAQAMTLDFIEASGLNLRPGTWASGHYRRRSCCLHCLHTPGDYCASCPRLSQQELPNQEPQNQEPLNDNQ